MKKRSKFLNSLLWTSGTIGGGVIYLLTAQLSFALTESFSMSAIYVGTVFLVSRIFDGITDFIAGNIIDRTHTKLGKARIYDRGLGLRDLLLQRSRKAFRSWKDRVCVRHV